MQIAVVRQLLSIFSGNELDIGITISVWLISVGAGSYLGHRINFKNAFAISFIAVAVLSQITVLFINLIRPVFSIEYGEVIPFGITVVSTFVSLFPLCFVVGMQFPLAISHLKDDPARIYGIEASGAFIGGVLFTLFLSGKIDMPSLSFVVSLLNIFVALLLMKKKMIISLLPLIFIFYLIISWIDTGIFVKGMELIEKVESSYGEVSILKMKGQFNIYTSGKFQFSYPDIQTEELKAHLPVSVHPSPENILVIGGSPAVLRELLKYKVNIDFIEIDKEVINASMRILNDKDRGIISDRRLKIITMDGRSFIKNLDRPAYDLVIINLPSPSTAQINRFYTIDFFRELKSVLKKDGIISLSLQTSSGYISRKIQMTNGSIYNSVRNVFRYTEVSSEEYGYLFASDSPIDVGIETLKERSRSSGINTGYFEQYIFEDAFSMFKTEMVKERLQKINVINRDIQPVSYLYSIMLWTEMHGGKLLNQILALKERQLLIMHGVLFIIIAAFFFKKRQSVYYSMFTTGYSVMSFSIIIILNFQARFGYVYETIGLITALFMFGMSIGAMIIKRQKSPLKLLRLTEIVSALFFTSSLLLLYNESIFYALSLLCGIIGGIQFVMANRCMSGDPGRYAGKIYAIDLAGSFPGALITSLVFVPLTGINNSVMFLSFIKMVSFILLLSVRHEKS